jgi:hypothetical protein
MTLFISIFALASVSRSVAQTESTETEKPYYFPQTGHNLSGDFLIAWENASDPMLIYGSPITEPYQDLVSGRLIQYLERARFEHFPENPPELRIVISHLGYLSVKNPSEFAAMGPIPGCRYFSANRKSVCYDFLEFFNKYGGVAQFGYPVTNFALEDGWIVQYFQRARFEWHPELPPGQKVTLTDLGSRYFDLIGEDPVRLRAVPPLAGSVPWLPESPGSALIGNQIILDLDVQAVPASPTTHTSGKQTIYVTVQDQTLIPVPGAAISITVTFPSGDARGTSEPLLTNQNGIAKFDFEFSDQRPGLAHVRVIAVYEKLRSDTVTSFLIWW